MRPNLMGTVVALAALIAAGAARADQPGGSYPSLGSTLLDPSVPLDDSHYVQLNPAADIYLPDSQPVCADCCDDQRG